MPLVRLASGDNDSNAFVNQLGSKGLLLGPNSTLAVRSFSVNPAERIGIVAGVNNTFVLKLDKSAAESFTVTIPPGEYNTLQELAPVLARAMNDACVMQEFTDSTSGDPVALGSSCAVRLKRHGTKPIGFRLSVYGPVPATVVSWGGTGNPGLHKVVLTGTTGSGIERADNTKEGFDGSYAVGDPLSRGAGEFQCQISGAKKGTAYIYRGYCGLTTVAPTKPSPQRAGRRLMFGAWIQHGQNIILNYPGVAAVDTGKRTTRQTAVLFRRAGDKMYFYYKDDGSSTTELWKDLAAPYTAGGLPDVLHPVLALADASQFVRIRYMQDISSQALPLMSEGETSAPPDRLTAVVTHDNDDGTQTELGAVNCNTVKEFTWGFAGPTLGFTSGTTDSDASRLITVESQRTPLGQDEHPALSVHCPSLPVHSINGVLARVDHCICDAPKTELVAVGGDNKLVWHEQFPLRLPIGYASPTRVSELRIEIRDSDGNLAALRGRSTICLLIDE